LPESASVGRSSKNQAEPGQTRDRQREILRDGRDPVRGAGDQGPKQRDDREVERRAASPQQEEAEGEDGGRAGGQADYARLLGAGGNAVSPLPARGGHPFWDRPLSSSRASQAPGGRPAGPLPQVSAVSTIRGSSDSAGATPRAWTRQLATPQASTIPSPAPPAMRRGLEA
jgi:hypothetical protein